MGFFTGIFIALQVEAVAGFAIWFLVELLRRLL